MNRRYGRAFVVAGNFPSAWQRFFRASEKLDTFNAMASGRLTVDQLVRARICLSACMWAFLAATSSPSTALKRSTWPAARPASPSQCCTARRSRRRIR